MKLSGIEGVNPDVERKIRQSINEAELKGWKIAPTITISVRSKLCCPLGSAFIWRILSIPSFDEIAYEFGILPSDAVSFANGFDGNFGQGPYYKLGQLMSKEYADK